MRNIPFRTKKSNFYKLLICFIIAVSVPALGIAALSIKHSTDNIIEQGSKANETILKEKRYSLSQKVAEFDNLIFQLANNEEVWNLLRSDEIYPDSYSDQLKIQDVVKIIYSAITRNEIIQSIYIYDQNHDFILSTTKCLKEDFYDKGVFDIKMTDNVFIGIRQIPSRSGPLSDKVVTYIRKLKDIKSDDTVWIVLNINYKTFFNFLESDDYEIPNGFLICNSKYDIVYSSVLPIDTLQQSDLKEIAEGSAVTVKKIKNDRYLVCKSDSSIPDWTMVFIQPYEELVHTARLIINLIAYSVLIILLLSFIMVYLFSLNLYKPIAKLVVDAEEYTGSRVKQPNSYMHEYKHENNEYRIIEKAIKRLFSQNNELFLKYNMTFPYFRDNFLNGLLSDNNFNIEKFNSFLDMLGIYFTYPRFISVLIDFENSEFTEDIRTRLEACLINSSQGLNYIISNITSSRIVILINTEYDNDMIYSIMLKLKNELNSQNIKVTLSIGKMYDDINKIYASYTEALSQIEDKFFIGINEIMQYSGDRTVKKAFFYDRKLEEDMVNHIKSQNLSGAMGALKKLTQELLNNSCSIEYIKYIYFQIINNIVHGLEDIGVKQSEADMSNTFIFEKISNAETFSELQSFVSMFIEKNISMLESLKDMKHNALVNKAIDFIDRNFTNDLSLEDIARELFISPRYLNSIFKNQMGMTIFEHITERRMEKAKDLIANYHVKIQDIAKEIGYNSVQGFFKVFKKRYKMTPIEYRRKFTVL